MKQIEKTARGKFNVSTPGVSESKLSLDFNPVIEKLSDRERQQAYKLIHWQAKPRGYREWGIYDAKTDSYTCDVWENLPAFYGAGRLIMLDDKTAQSIPSAVIYHVGSLKV